MRFVDTNILLYAFGSDDGTGRSQVAKEVLGEADLAFSIQVFQEFFVQATHVRRKDPLSSEEALTVIDLLSEFPVQSNTMSLFRNAVRIQQESQTSFWDANIIAAASALECRVILSEDLNHSQEYSGVKVINPFKPEE